MIYVTTLVDKSELVIFHLCYLHYTILFPDPVTLYNPVFVHIYTSRLNKGKFPTTPCVLFEDATHVITDSVRLRLTSPKTS